MNLHELEPTFGDSLIERDIAGIYVGLFYDRKNDEAFIGYSDEKEGLEFVLNPPKFLAMDAYTHPIIYFHGELNGKSNPKRLVAA